LLRYVENSFVLQLGCKNSSFIINETAICDL